MQKRCNWNHCPSEPTGAQNTSLSTAAVMEAAPRDVDRQADNNAPAPAAKGLELPWVRSVACPTALHRHDANALQQPCMYVHCSCYQAGGTIQSVFEPWSTDLLFKACSPGCDACHTTHCMQLEKYRPSQIKDIVGNAEAVARLQVIAQEGNMPNVILAVSAGSGALTRNVGLPCMLSSSLHLVCPAFSLHATAWVCHGTYRLMSCLCHAVFGMQGPPGTGKTTSILCLAAQLLGPNYKNAVLELNASDDRWGLFWSLYARVLCVLRCSLRPLQLNVSCAAALQGH